jgi:3-oxoacyl-[acyl-carrier-protein] synthase II
VVVTGLGVVSPIGIGTDIFWSNLIAGKSGVGRITHFDPTLFSTQLAAEVKDFNPSDYLDKKEARRLVHFIQYAVAAAQLAVKDAALSITPENNNEVGVIIGSGIGGLQMCEESCKVLLEKGPDRISPFAVPYMIADMAAGYVSIMLGAKGPNTCVVTACASGSHSIGEAFRLIQRGDAIAMIAGGTEACITPLGVGSFCAARALSNSGSRPFDKTRDGFIIGEGSGIVILEELETAQKRGARIYAEIIGYGMSADAHHITAPAPGGEGAVRSMQKAMKDAKLQPEKIDYINAHGTSTELNDKFETLAIKTTFGEYAYRLPISSNKSMIGHLLGASGAVEFIATIKTLTENIIPPTVNYETPDPECDLNYVPNQAMKKSVNIAMSNSFGFGGHNATLIATKYQP